MFQRVFDPQAIHEAALRGIGLSSERMFEAVSDALDERYPGKIDRAQPWLFNMAGGVLIQIKIVYASLSEYVMYWGTPIGTYGYSGRHAAEFHDTVLAGEAWYHEEGQLERRVYRPGDHILVRRGEAAGMRIPDHLWCVEYARGAMPLLLPFGLADALFSTLDYKTVALTLRSYAQLLRRSMGVQPPGLSGSLAIVVGLGFGVLALSRRPGPRRARSR